MAGTCGAPCAFGATGLGDSRIADLAPSRQFVITMFFLPKGYSVYSPWLSRPLLSRSASAWACEDGSGHTLFCIMTSHSGFTVVEEHNFRQGDATSDEIEQCVLGECVGVRPGSRRHGVDHSALCQRSRSPSNGPVS